MSSTGRPSFFSPTSRIRSDHPKKIGRVWSKRGTLGPIELQGVCAHSPCGPERDVVRWGQIESSTSRGTSEDQRFYGGGTQGVGTAGRCRAAPDVVGHGISLDGRDRFTVAAQPGSAGGKARKVKCWQRAIINWWNRKKSKFTSGLTDFNKILLDYQLGGKSAKMLMTIWRYKKGPKNRALNEDLFFNHPYFYFCLNLRM